MVILVCACYMFLHFNIFLLSSQNASALYVMSALSNENNVSAAWRKRLKRVKVASRAQMRWKHEPQQWFSGFESRTNYATQVRASGKVLFTQLHIHETAASHRLQQTPIKAAAQPAGNDRRKPTSMDIGGMGGSCGHVYASRHPP